MVKKSIGRYSVEGVLSFLKGCDVFSMGRNNDDTTFFFASYTESPLAYTKLSCYLPWVAEEFGLYLIEAKLFCDPRRVII